MRMRAARLEAETRVDRTVLEICRLIPDSGILLRTVGDRFEIALQAAKGTR